MKWVLLILPLWGNPVDLPRELVFDTWERCNAEVARVEEWRAYDGDPAHRAFCVEQRRE